ALATSEFDLVVCDLLLSGLPAARALSVNAEFGRGAPVRGGAEFSGAELRGPLRRLGADGIFEKGRADAFLVAVREAIERMPSGPS
ncbi:MAG: hypothetical protein ACT4PT_13820, partial [Methanobacteriota archaeon]